MFKITLVSLIIIVSLVIGYQIFPKSCDKENAPLLLDLARDTFRFFDTPKFYQNHLISDGVWLSETNEVRKISHYTTITNAGMNLLAILAAMDLNFIDRAGAIQRIEPILHAIQRLPTHRGYFLRSAHLKDLSPGEPKEISTVDLGWLLVALMISGEEFDGHFKSITAPLIESNNLQWLYDEKVNQFYLGYNTDEEHYLDKDETGNKSDSPFHYGLLCSEARIVSYIAMALGQVPLKHWYHLYRTLPKEWLQNQVPTGNQKTFEGHSYFEGFYTYGDIHMIPSWGGSTFEFLMPTLLMDEKRYAPHGIGENNQRAVAIHKLHALKHLGYPVWGLSPAYNAQKQYLALGVPEIGSTVKHYQENLIAPYASILAIDIDPKSVVRNIEILRDQFHAWGPYGFFDSIDPKTGEIARVYLALDQGMILVGLSNYLADHKMQKRFSRLPGMDRVIKLISDEKIDY